MLRSYLIWGSTNLSFSFYFYIHRLTFTCNLLNVIVHLLFSAVEHIVRKTNKEELRRRMSHGEVLKFSEAVNQVPSGFNNSISTGQVNRASNEYKTVMNDKPDYFKANVTVRSQSSSSNTSR